MKKGGAMALLVPLVVALLFSASSSEAMLPSSVEIVASILEKAHNQDPRMGMAASLLRLHFHDCFAKAGCDASLLLDSSGSSIVNKDDSAGGFEITDDGIKAAIETACCPDTAVSCADILALAARDREAAAAAAAAPYHAPPALQAPARRLLIKGTTTTTTTTPHIAIVSAGSTGVAPSPQPPTQRAHATKLPGWLISLIAALAAMLGVGGVIGAHCCYNNRLEIYLRHGQAEEQAHQQQVPAATGAGDLEMSEIKN